MRRALRVPGGCGSETAHIAAARSAFGDLRGFLVFRRVRRRNGTERNLGEGGIARRLTEVEVGVEVELPGEGAGQGSELVDMVKTGVWRQEVGEVDGEEFCSKASDPMSISRGGDGNGTREMLPSLKSTRARGARRSRESTRVRGKWKKIKKKSKYKKIKNTKKIRNENLHVYGGEG